MTNQNKYAEGNTARSAYRGKSNDLRALEDENPSEMTKAWADHKADEEAQGIARRLQGNPAFFRMVVTKLNRILQGKPVEDLERQKYEKLRDELRRDFGLDDNA